MAEIAAVAAIAGETGDAGNVMEGCRPQGDRCHRSLKASPLLSSPMMQNFHHVLYPGFVYCIVNFNIVGDQQVVRSWHMRLLIPIPRVLIKT